MALELNGTTGVSLVQDGVVTAADLSSTLDLSSKTITGIPVTNEFAQYVRNFGANVDGTTSTTGWNTVPLNNEISDTIGASIGSPSAYAITLPAGTYFVMGFCSLYDTDRNGCRLRDTADTTTLMTGGGVYANGSTNSGGAAYISGQMTLESSTSFYFQVFVQVGGQPLGLRPASGESWQQSYLNIWKIA